MNLYFMWSTSRTFPSCKVLTIVSSEALWAALRACWIDVYRSPPDVIAHDVSKNIMRRIFQDNADMLHIVAKSIPIGAANSMPIVLRYHKPLRCAYSIKKQEAPDTDKIIALQMALKSINDLLGSNGLVPTLFVFGALSRLGLPTDQTSLSTFKRVTALQKATASMSRHFASRPFCETMSSWNGSVTMETHRMPVRRQFSSTAPNSISRQDLLIYRRQTARTSLSFFHLHLYRPNSGVPSLNHTSWKTTTTTWTEIKLDFRENQPLWKQKHSEQR